MICFVVNYNIGRKIRCGIKFYYINWKWRILKFIFFILNFIVFLKRIFLLILVYSVGGESSWFIINCSICNWWWIFIVYRFIVKLFIYRLNFSVCVYSYRIVDYCVFIVVYIGCKRIVFLFRYWYVSVRNFRRFVISY